MSSATLVERDRGRLPVGALSNRRPRTQTEARARPAGSQVVVFGCNRSDDGSDGLNLRIIERIAAAAPPTTTVSTLDPPELDVLLNLENVRLLVLVDVVPAGPQFPAGSWTKVTYGGHGTGKRRGRPPRVPKPVPLAPTTCAAINPRSLKLNSVLELGRRLGVLPVNVWVYVVAEARQGQNGAAWLDMDDDLGPIVAAIRHDVVAWLTHGVN
jgi:hypothetical protein